MQSKQIKKLPDTPQGSLGARVKMYKWLLSTIAPNCCNICGSYGIKELQLVQLGGTEYMNAQLQDTVGPAEYSQRFLQHFRQHFLRLKWAFCQRPGTFLGGMELRKIWGLPMLFYCTLK
ncbi:hypothetical protein scyTo_0007490 [Scyliorhinus torazame]|uniref:Uncharacterized protein n=1 Tax=Scyliorhinus torazame TaxID=75743 RepID=A0A401NTC6_SCYTO|nr:hypothetical protein [Scyliorhinus torazame]